jgi:L-lysine cyclodeaminase
MPHHDPGDSVTIKIVAYTPDNARRFALPTIIGTVARFDEASGRLLALADAVLLTALRTGAASAITSRILARPDSRVMGLVGAGAQAVTQLHALTRVLPIRSALVWDTDPGRAASFATRVAFLGIEVEIAEPARIAAESDIISTATSVAVGEGPVLPDLGLKEHLHINAVGSDLVGKTELPRTVVERALVCPDHPEQARVEGEAQQIPGRRLGPRLTELCADPGSFAGHRDRLTVFDSTGYALEDHLCLDVLLEAAIELGLGTQIRIECHPAVAVDPYSITERGGVTPIRHPSPVSRPDL